MFQIKGIRKHQSICDWCWFGEYQQLITEYKERHATYRKLVNIADRTERYRLHMRKTQVKNSERLLKYLKDISTPPEGWKKAEAREAKRSSRLADIEYKSEEKKIKDSLEKNPHPHRMFRGDIILKCYQFEGHKCIPSEMQKWVDDEVMPESIYFGVLIRHCCKFHKDQCSPKSLKNAMKTKVKVREYFNEYLRSRDEAKNSERNHVRGGSKLRGRSRKASAKTRNVGTPIDTERTD